MRRLLAIFSVVLMVPTVAHGDEGGCAADEWMSPQGRCVHEDQLRDRFFLEAVRETEQHWMHGEVLDRWLCRRPRHWHRHHGVGTMPEACDR